MTKYLDNHILDLDDTDIPDDLKIKSAWYGKIDAYSIFVDSRIAMTALTEREIIIVKGNVKDLLIDILFSKLNQRAVRGTHDVITSRSMNAIRANGVKVHEHYLDSIVKPLFDDDRSIINFEKKIHSI